MEIDEPTHNARQDNEPGLVPVSHIHLDRPGSRTGNTDADLPASSFGAANAARRYVMRQPAPERQPKVEEGAENQAALELEVEAETATEAELDSSEARERAVTAGGRPDREPAPVIGYRQPAPAPGPRRARSSAEGSRGRRRVLPVLALTLLLGFVGAITAITTSGGTQAHGSHDKNLGHQRTGRASVQTVTQPVTATTRAATKNRVRHHKKHHKPAVRRTSTTTTGATYTQTYSTPAATETTAVNTEQTTSTSTKTTAAKTTAVKTTASKTSTGSGTGPSNCAQAMNGYQSGDLPTPAQAACAP
jgi:hypothetical protein